MNPATEGSRRSTTQSRQLVWASYYVMNVTNDSLDPSYYFASLTEVMSTYEPTCYSEAKGVPEWELAMNKELSALDENVTWELSEFPTGQKAIGSKWIFKIKFHSDGTIERHKARLVVKEYDQKLGKDCKHTFSLVTKLPIVRIFIALATA